MAHVCATEFGPSEIKGDLHPQWHLYEGWDSDGFGSGSGSGLERTTRRVRGDGSAQLVRRLIRLRRGARRVFKYQCEVIYRERRTCVVSRSSVPCAVVPRCNPSEGGSENCTRNSKNVTCIPHEHLVRSEGMNPSFLIQDETSSHRTSHVGKAPFRQPCGARAQIQDQGRDSVQISHARGLRQRLTSLPFVTRGGKGNKMVAVGDKFPQRDPPEGSFPPRRST